MLNIFTKKMIVIADVFPILRNPKIVVKKMSLKSRLRRSLKKQHGKADQTLLKSERFSFSIFIDYCEGN